MAVLTLPHTLTHAQARDCLMQVAQDMADMQDRVVLLDASALQIFDSSALAVLLACRRKALALGRRFQIQGMPERLRELAALYGVLMLLQA